MDDERLGVGDVGGRGQRSFSTEPMVGSISSGTYLGDGREIDLCFRMGVLGDADAGLEAGDISYVILAGGDSAGGGIWRAERPRDLAVGDPRYDIVDSMNALSSSGVYLEVGLTDRMLGLTGLFPEIKLVL